MKKLLVLFIYLTLASILFAQDWQARIVVRGSLPGDTDVSEFEANLKTAIISNLDDPNFKFVETIVVTPDTATISVVAKITGGVKETKELETFEIAVYNYFHNLFDSAAVVLQYKGLREW